MTKTSDTGVGSRERIAERLLRSSADRSYDPLVDIDWSVPPVADKHFLPERRISLYGTDLWQRMTPEQRVELGKQELVSITSFGIYVEVLLMHLLLKVTVQGDPASRHAQYALTEVADECRHSTMFGRAIERFGMRPYRPRWWVRPSINLAPLAPIGPASWGGTLLVEEILDRLQRETMADENIQPTVRMVNRIHVLEEARHISFARAELTRLAGTMSRPRLAVERLALAASALFAVRLMLSPEVYRAVGLNPRQARRAARTNPNYQHSLAWMGERLVRFLTEAGMIKGPLVRYVWRRSGLLTGG